MKNKILIIGSGGQARSSIDLCNFLSKDYQQISIEDIDAFIKQDDDNTKKQYIVSVGDRDIRKSIVERLNLNNLCLTSLIHPSAIISETAILNPRVFIGAKAYIGPKVQIGNSCIINTGSIIEHDTKIGNFTNIGPNAVLCGNVEIGNNSFIGVSSIIIENISIADNVFVAAGALVINNIKQEFTKQKGIPSKPWK